MRLYSPSVIKVDKAAVVDSGADRIPVALNGKGILCYLNGKQTRLYSPLYNETAAGGTANTKGAGITLSDYEYGIYFYGNDIRTSCPTTGGYMGLYIGSVWANGTNVHSSINSKDNIISLNEVLDKVNNMNICEYDRTDSDISQIGLIVEDDNTPLEVIIKEPDHLESDSKGNVNVVKGKNYIDLYSLLSLGLKATQELNSKTETNNELNQSSNIELYENLNQIDNDTKLAIADTYENLNNTIDKQTSMELAITELYEILLSA